MADAERVKMLSPVRLFTLDRFASDDPEVAERLLISLLNSIGAMAVVIEQRSGEPEMIDYMLFRFGQEMPNIRRLIEESELRSDDRDLVALALTVTSAMVRYFFVLKLGDEGAALMRRGAELALRIGDTRRAAALTSQYVALLGRSVVGRKAEALSLLDLVSAVAGEEPKTLADLNCARALLALDAGDGELGLEQAELALSHFRKVAEKLKSDLERIGDGEESQDRKADLDDNFATAFRLKADALLAMGRYQKASATYRHSLRHIAGASAAVNVGQIIHQIGNCESHLGNYGEAARLYVQAAGIFHSVGMREFLGNATGELDFSLIDEDSPSARDIDDNIYASALSDLEYDLGHVLRAEPFNADLSLRVTRKVFGTLVAGVFTGRAPAGGDWAFRIATGGHFSPTPDRTDGRNVMALFALDRVLQVAFVIADLEDGTDANGDPDEGHVHALLALCCDCPPFVREFLRLTDFLSAYLSRRLDVTNASPERLKVFAENSDEGIDDELTLERTR